MLPMKFAREIFIYISMSVMVFIIHAVIDFHYHSICRSNLINIVLFGNSNICNILGSILQKTELFSHSFLNSYTKILSI